MLNEKIIKLMQKQIKEEIESAYIYLDFANWLDSQGLPGFANWYRIQVKEELDHANFFMEYLLLNNVEVVLSDIKKSPITIKNVKQLLDEGLKHEEYVTKCINTIYDEAVKQKDYRSMQFLDWFIKEQLEEEVNATDLIDKYKLVDKPSGGGLFQLDNELGKREYTVPTFEVA